MRIAFITIDSGLVPLIEGLCAQICYLKCEIIIGLRSHLLFLISSTLFVCLFRIVSLIFLSWGFKRTTPDADARHSKSPNRRAPLDPLPNRAGTERTCPNEPGTGGTPKGPVTWHWGTPKGTVTWHPKGQCQVTGPFGIPPYPLGQVCL